MGDYVIHRNQLYRPQLTSILHSCYESQSQRLAVLRNDFSIEIWNVHDYFTLERTIPAKNSSSIEVLSWFNSYLLSAGLDGQLILYDHLTYRQLKVTNTIGGSIWCINKQRKKEKHDRIAIGTELGYVSIYEISGLDDKNELDIKLVKTVCKQEQRILSLAWHSTDDDFLVAGSLNMIYICSIKQGRCIQQINVGKITTSVRRQQNKNVSYKQHQQDTIIWCLQIAEDYTVFSGDSSGRTCVWDAVYGTLIRSFQTHRIEPVIARIELVNKSTMMTTPETNGTLQHVNRLNKQWIKTMSLNCHSHDVRSLTLIQHQAQTEKYFLVSGGLDCRLLVHEIKQDNSKPPQLVKKCYNFVQQQLIHRDGNLFLFQYSDYVELWTMGNTVTKIDSKQEQQHKSGDCLPLTQLPQHLVQIKTKHSGKLYSSNLAQIEHQSIVALSDTAGLHLYLVKGVDAALHQVKVSSIKTYIIPPKSSQSSVSKLLSSIQNVIQIQFSHQDQQQLLLFVLTDLNELYCLSISSSFTQLSLECIINCTNNSDKLSSVLKFEVSPTSEYISTSDNHGSVLIWSRSSGECLQRLPLQLNQCTAMKFHPTEPYLICAYSNQHLFEYNFAPQNGEYTNWTRKSLTRIPVQWYYDKNIITNLFYSNDDKKLHVIDQNYLTVFDKQKKMPSLYTKIFSKQHSQSSIHICKQFKYILYVNMIDSSKNDDVKQLFIVEMTPAMIEQCLPPALKRKKFGS
ncbi:unnamed protein product [Didymodactylos carnosus]|uniref:Uncharacterized protein n=1 Tax=Didymodactylos carnosus TaxID=1234261 RepID=A0A814BZF7_9BILA|nr:unnamed protein product [Didymodactylos carnosus]CAF0936958.1 unnamed protein product [Didymodactylos carnosus]CAF3659915.1 unnamed protein product [Didymodactylos carnosus]CAF3714005.1 unnamed protein product [Didymodactylos carnosus]